MVGLTIESVKLTPEAADRIFQTAIDGGVTYGFGYWAKMIGIVRSVIAGDPEGGLIKSIQLREHDKPNRTRTIDVTDLERGIAKMLSDPKGISLNGLAEEYPDGPTSEVILQYAMFGEQVYG